MLSRSSLHRIGAVSGLAFLVNVPLGSWRSTTERFSVEWLAAVHASVPLIALVRRRLILPHFAVPLNIAAAVGGQLVGSSLVDSGWQQMRLAHD